MTSNKVRNVFMALAAFTFAMVFSILMLPDATARAEEVHYSIDATATAEQLADQPGVYYAKAVKGDVDSETTPKTIGIPSIAKQFLADNPTKEAPAIIMGAAAKFEEKVPGKTEYRKLPGVEGDQPLPPYRYFRYQIMDEQGQDGTIHKKLSGFDGSYYLIRVDVSDIIAGADKDSYLHVKQGVNKALLVAMGMEGTTFANAGTKTGSYSLADNAAAMKDTEGNHKDTAYFDIIVISSNKLAAGADQGQQDAPSADFKLSFYVDKTADYNPELTYDPNNIPAQWPATIAGKEYATEQDYLAALHAKFFDDSKATAPEANNTYTSYNVKGSDLEIDVAVDDTGDESFADPDYWSMEKAIYYQKYDSHTIKLICEVPVLDGLDISGTPEQKRNVILDVNSFDIQIANSSEQDKAGLTVRDNAQLTLKDNTKTSGAELAIGNNAQMHVKNGGTMIIDRSCQLEVEFDAASVPEGETGPTLNQGQIVVYSGGKLINNGVVNVEGTEGKPVDPAAGTAPREMNKASMLVQRGGVFENYGCLSVKGSMYVRGTLNNYGKYEDIIQAGDPDKGVIPYHKGIQVTWKDDVTQEGVVPGDLNVGKDVGQKIAEDDPELQIADGGVLNNYGDIVLVPGTFTLYGTFNNTKNPDQGDYAGHLYLCTVTEAWIPIIPTQEAPTVVEKKVTLDKPVDSQFITAGDESKVNNDGLIAQATVELVSNGVLGDLTQVYTVQFNTGKGSKLPDQKVKVGGKLTKPKDPVLDGYDFAGWYKEAACQNAWNFDKDTVDKDLTVYAKWTVKKAAPAVSKVSSIKIIAPSKKLAVKKKIALGVEVLPKNASNKVTWSINDKKYGSITSKGVLKLTNKAKGKKVKITATAADGSGVKTTITIKGMKGIVKKVKINGPKKVKAGKSIGLKAVVTASKGANKTIKWTSSNKKYAKVSSKGKVTSYKAGKGKTVTITAKAVDGSGKKATRKIKIK